MSRDEALDRELGETAKQEVESLRGSGELPSPRLSAERIGQLEGTLDYPHAARSTHATTREERPSLFPPSRDSITGKAKNKRQKESGGGWRCPEGVRICLSTLAS